MFVLFLCISISFLFAANKNCADKNCFPVCDSSLWHHIIFIRSGREKSVWQMCWAGIHTDWCQDSLQVWQPRKLLPRVEVQPLGIEGTSSVLKQCTWNCLLLNELTCWIEYMSGKARCVIHYTRNKGSLPSFFLCCQNPHS